MLSDQHQRMQATDPNRSFIVQAPAGSGKTEILTQRYLRLLGIVSAPEQIVALTFTRKAANEMRERILLALQQVANGAEATSDHQKQTYAFASEALLQNKKHNWQLLEQPSRLRIITIDSLCQTLTQAIPLQEKQISYANISEKPQGYYLDAARACFSYALHNEEYQQSLKTLLHHVDNRQDKLLDLFSDLLASRDQWLITLYQAQAQEKSAYEQALLWIEQHELSRFYQSLPQTDADELTNLVRQFTSLLATPNSPSYLLRDWSIFDELDIHRASALAHLLTTSQDTLRKAFDHHVGLKRGVCSDDEYNSIKTESKTLLGKLSESPEFLEALLRIKRLPEPQYHPEQWEVLQSLFALLPLLIGHLHLIFNEHNEVDFTAVSQQALQALGDDDSPTDLALYLDNTIHHLLVDEFQDTSIQQFQLLTKLVQGWQPDDGRTLFIVGDPMQSIYRFRQAEVGLFLRAKQHGIGSVHLHPLALCCNFRSTATIVDWVNLQFKTIFPQLDDIESGAVSFHSSINVQQATDDSKIAAAQYATREQEAAAIVELATSELEKNPTDDISILVRSRKQLSDIIQLLRVQQIPYQGVDIDLLAELPHLRDIWSLTQTLLMPANRLAWLSLLRSPYGGVTLADLHCIANFNKKKSIYYALSYLDDIPELSKEGRLRAGFVYQVLDNALASRHQQRLVDWVVSTLKQLYGDIILNSLEQNDLEQYWLLLDRFEQDGQLADLKQFKEAFNQLYSQRVVPSRLQIMTIHKSKGLEFDCVILPGLGSKSSNQDKPLLRWLKLPTEEHGELLLVSPIKASHHEHCLLYDYLGKLDAEKNNYELQRLLYVAVTRAKKRLYLFDNSDKITQGSFRSLLQNQEFTSTTEEISDAELENKHPNLYQLPARFYQETPSSALLQTVASLTINDSTPRLIGIVAHELLQWICDNHPTSISEVPWDLAHHQLKIMGFNPVSINDICDTLYSEFEHIFNDSIGQWIIKAHENEHNEYELLINDNGVVKTRIIDRTFYENNTRWIIDFKTGREDESTQKHHRDQVNDYARLLSQNTSHPIRCGLYYLSRGHWVSWDYEA